MIIDTVTVTAITKDSSRPGEREIKTINSSFIKKTSIYLYIIYYIPDGEPVGESGKGGIGEENTYIMEISVCVHVCMCVCACVRAV